MEIGPMLKLTLYSIWPYIRRTIYPRTSVKTNVPPAEPPANYPANNPAKPPVASKSQYPAGTKHPVRARGSAFCQIFGHLSKYLANFDHILMFWNKNLPFWMLIFNKYSANLAKCSVFAKPPAPYRRSGSGQMFGNLTGRRSGSGRRTKFNLRFNTAEDYIYNIYCVSKSGIKWISKLRIRCNKTLN